MRSDPLGLYDGTNPYNYVYGDPLHYTDPTGEFGVVGALVGGAGNFAYQMWKNGGRLECVNYWEVAGWALTGSGAGIGARAVTSGLANRFVTNGVSKSAFQKYSRKYWKARGGAGNQFPYPKQLHHWMINRSRGVNSQNAIINNVTNGGWNLLETPWRLNTWMGGIGVKQTPFNNFARTATEHAIRVTVFGTAGIGGYGGYQVGKNAQEEPNCECQ